MISEVKVRIGPNPVWLPIREIASIWIRISIKNVPSCRGVGPNPAAGNCCETRKQMLECWSKSTEALAGIPNVAGRGVATAIRRRQNGLSGRAAYVRASGGGRQLFESCNCYEYQDIDRLASDRQP